MKDHTTPSQRRTWSRLTDLAHTFGLRRTWAVDALGRLWVEVECPAQTDLERDLVAEYGQITRAYIVSRRGIWTETTMDIPADIVAGGSFTRQKTTP